MRPGDIKARARAELSAQKEKVAGTRAVAARMVDAERAFLQTLMTLGDITRAQAERVFESYRSHKAIRRDLSAGRYTVVHGGLLDRAVIRRTAGVQ